MINRGGRILHTGKVGFVKCLRQQKLLPGENMRINLRGELKMSALRERDALPINAHLAVFMTPIRWLEPNWTDIIKEGPTTSKAVSFVEKIPRTLGIGGSAAKMIQSYWEQAFLRVYNEWYKWPEDDDITVVGVGNIDGLPGVNLEHSWTRCKDTGVPDETADSQVDGTTLTVAELADIQARYASAIDREVMSYERYMELLKRIYDRDGTREVDQVPIKLTETDIGVKPRSYPATDGPNLGEWASLYDFRIDHDFDLVAPEHMILTYVLTVRFMPMTEENHPLASNRLTYAEEVGDPRLLEAAPPAEVQLRDVFDSVSSTPLGFLPAGWRWRAMNNLVGGRIDIRNSFPYMRQPLNAAQARDATRTNNAFRTTSLGQYIVDITATERSNNIIPEAETSYYLGMDMGKKPSKGAYPNKAKVK